MEKILHIKIGDHKSQQVCEAMVALVALRLWSSRWRGSRCILEVKSDSVSALKLVLDLETSGLGNGIIAREVALDIAQSVYKPQVISHISGIANKTADCLSRIHEPGAGRKIPPHLKYVHRSRLKKPHKNIFRTLAAIPRCIVP